MSRFVHVHHRQVGDFHRYGWAIHLLYISTRKRLLGTSFAGQKIDFLASFLKEKGKLGKKWVKLLLLDASSHQNAGSAPCEIC